MGGGERERDKFHGSLGCGIQAKLLSTDLLRLPIFNSYFRLELVIISYSIRKR